ncbi:Ca2+ regulator and membrane fusion protein Fig1-domain-containing protein [Colletotrichum cereale]|nr:Ca2+ regulator and membrane fusion protein Fig1-domain-containing protein [Colletotrichum cereale]
MCLISLSYSNDATNHGLNPTGTANSSAPAAATDASFEVRVGYFGMCMMSSDQWICSKDSRALESFANRSQTGVINDPIRLISSAEKFKDEVIFKGLHFISIIFGLFAFILLTTFPAWNEEEDSNGSEREVKPFPSRPVSLITLACIFFSAVISLLATFWQHLSSSAAIAMSSAFTQGAVTGHVGAVAMALGWISVFLLTTTFIGLLVIILSIRVLSQLVD